MSTVYIMSFGPNGERTRVLSTAREAGEAYYSTKGEDLPSIVRVANDRPLNYAGTSKQSNYANGDERHYKRLPTLDMTDAKEFHAGYFHAMEHDLPNRFKDAERIGDIPPKLVDDLENMNGYSRDLATSAWARFAPTSLVGKRPAFIQGIDAAEIQNAAVKRDEALADFPKVEFEALPGWTARLGGNKTVQGDMEHEAPIVIETKVGSRIDLSGDASEIKGFAEKYGLSKKDTELLQEMGIESLDRQGLPDERLMNSVEPDSEADQRKVISPEDALRRVQVQRDYDDERLRTQNALGLRAEDDRIDLENLNEKAEELDDENLLAARTGANPVLTEAAVTDQERDHSMHLIEQVHQQFRVAGNRYHFKDRPNKTAFRDKGSRLVSSSNDERVAQAMATMAEAKGWQSIRVSGHPDFRREVWLEASLRGLNVKGYTPTEKDIADLESKQERASRNQIERDERGKGKTASAQGAKADFSSNGKAPQASQKTPAKGEFLGRLVNHGHAPYQNEKDAGESYFVTLATEKGEKTIWGIDLARAMAESKANTGDEITLKHRGKEQVKVPDVQRDDKGKVVFVGEKDAIRNAWEVEKSGKHQVIEAVASEVLRSQGVSQQNRDKIMHAVNERLSTREQQGRVPNVAMYDKTAPAKGGAQRTAPVVEVNAERSR